MLHNRGFLVIRIIQWRVCVNPKLLGMRFFIHQVFLDKPPPEPEAQGTVMGIVVLTPQETVLSPNNSVPLQLTVV